MWTATLPSNLHLCLQVLAGVVADENDNPYEVILNNNRHEQKLKDWKKMAPEEK